MMTGKIDTNNMRQVTREQLEYLLNPEGDLLLDSYFLLLNDVDMDEYDLSPLRPQFNADAA